MSPSVLPVVLGVESTNNSDSAVRWAAAEAASRRVPLTIITSFDWTLSMEGMAALYGDHPDPGLLRSRQEAEQAAARAELLAIELYPELDVTAEAVDGNPIKELTELSRSASLVVVGSRGHRGARSILTGSVGDAVATHAHSPVVVVRSVPGLDEEDARIVVGVDGSRSSNALMDFAVDRSVRFGNAVQVVLCWWLNVLTPVHSAVASSANEANRWLAEVIAGRREEHPEIDFHASVMEGHPIDALVGAAHSQSLLVVGNRRRTVIGGALLGSVTQGVLHQATCPVAVVPIPTGDSG